MAARLKRGVKGGPAGQPAGGVESYDLSMFTPIEYVEAFSHDAPALDDHCAHSWIGMGECDAAPCKFESARHVSIVD
jgi:hypothetical protein